MTLWSDFLRRLMLTVSLAGSATAAADPPPEAPEPPAEAGTPSPGPQDGAHPPPAAARA
ncbi:hypothetical protein [Crenalkalicoccus roseus]|uniref:hypothetical protein n=1 Tax=Crenalkalicoccus roseus TaxID=1485588 RepID=UPI001305386A|nr:hypothetical protein [Crenalkalicoccus roseus]